VLDSSRRKAGTTSPFRTFGKSVQRLPAIATAAATAAVATAAAAAAEAATVTAATTAAAAATVATTAATTVAAATTATTTSTTSLGLVHAERATTHVGAVESLDSCLGILGGLHLDEREATRATRVTIGDDRDGLDGSVRCEKVTKLVVSTRERQIAYVDLGTQCAIPCAE